MELIPFEGRLLLIDFNPRYYHHLAFENARAMPLPLFAHLAAIGEEKGLECLRQGRQASARPSGRAFTHRLGLGAAILGRHLTMSRKEARRWRLWYRQNRVNMVDAVADPRDRLPELIDVAQYLAHGARHPRAFVRSYLLDA